LQRRLIDVLLGFAWKRGLSIKFALAGRLENVIILSIEHISVSVYSDAFDIQGYSIDERFETDDLEGTEDAEDKLASALDRLFSSR